MKKSNLILLISLLLYLASLPFTAVYTKDHEMSGLACALLGWAEMEGGGIAWLANPLLFIGAFFLLLKQVKISAVIKPYCIWTYFLLSICWRNYSK